MHRKRFGKSRLLQKLAIIIINERCRRRLRGKWREREIRSAVWWYECAYRVVFRVSDV